MFFLIGEDFLYSAVFLLAIGEAWRVILLVISRIKGEVNLVALTSTLAVAAFGATFLTEAGFITTTSFVFLGVFLTLEGFT